MNTSSMMTGVLVVGSMNANLSIPHLNHYITEPATARKPQKNIPIRISVTKHK